MELICEECGHKGSMLVDGYAFGDRLLEGVMFKITLKGRKVTAENLPEDEGYMAGLNKKLWLKAAVEFALDGDDGECPKCGDNMMGITGLPEKPVVQPRAVKITSFEDIIGRR